MLPGGLPFQEIFGDILLLAFVGLVAVHRMVVSPLLRHRVHHNVLVMGTGPEARGLEASFSASNLPSMRLVGFYSHADQVNTIIAAGRADLVALARPHLVDPAFTIRAAAWYGAPEQHCPPQYRAGRDQLYRNSARDREELDELKLKAKPKTHATTWKQAAE